MQAVANKSERLFTYVSLKYLTVLLFDEYYEIEIAHNKTISNFKNKI